MQSTLTTTLTITLTPEQASRLHLAAEVLGRSAESFVNEVMQEHIENLLEELEDGIEANEIIRRMRSGETKGIPWEQVEAGLEAMGDDDEV